MEGKKEIYIVRRKSIKIKDGERERERKAERPRKR
jgi:hypothetical protein